MNLVKRAADREAVKENSRGQARFLRAAPGRAPQSGATLKGSKSDGVTAILKTILAPFQGALVGGSSPGAAPKKRAWPRLLYLTLSASGPAIQSRSWLALGRALFFAAALHVASCFALADLQVFGSFEEASEVQAVHATNGVRITSSKRFPAWKGDSLEVIFPAQGGAIEYSKIPTDWRRQEALLLFVWSEQPAQLEITLRDLSRASFSKAFNLRPGANHLQLAMASLVGINRAQMTQLSIQSRAAGTFYLDYFALDRFHPMLEKRGRWDINYSMDVPTPHVPWGRPFVNGPIHIYAIADVADGRGVVELAQRLESNFKATTIGRNTSTNKWGFGDFYEQRSAGGEFWIDAYSLAYTYIADDLIHGPEYDVILWPGLRPWESYPAEVRDAVRRRVESGTGLVFFYPFSRDGTAKNESLWNPSPLTRAQEVKSASSNNPLLNDLSRLDRSMWRPAAGHYITRGVPLAAFPWGHIGVPASRAVGEVLLETSEKVPVLAVGSAGRGRVVAFGYSEKGMIPEIEQVFETGLHYPYQEYLWSLVARAVTWAARKEPERGIEKISFLQDRVEISLNGPVPNARALVLVHNSFGELEAEISSRISLSSNNATSRFPHSLPPGRHFADVRVISGDKAFDWAAQVLDVPSRLKIEVLKLARDRVAAGEDVLVNLRLSSSEKIECLAKVRVLDNFDRLLDEQRLQITFAGETEKSVTLKSAGCLSHLARIECEVFAAGVRQDRRVAEVFILQPRKWDDYDIVMYRFGPDPIPGIWPTIDAQLQRLNVTTLSSYSLQHSKHANYNVQAQTRISGQESPDGAARAYYTAMKKKYLETGDKNVLVREYCLDDPAYRARIREELTRLTAPWVPFSPLSYYVLEEPSLTCYGDAVDICFSPFTLAAMRRWLQNSYGSLEALNQQWSTDFHRWEDVTPDDSPAAQKRGNYASWADHRTYMETVYAGTFEYVLHELQRIDPGGILLNSGTQISGSHNGCDYSRVDLFTRHLNAYEGGNQLDFHRCFNPDLKISGGAGYGVLGKDVFYNLYNSLFKGANGGAYIFWQYSTIDPDLTLSQSGKDMEVGFREIRGDGIGKLVGLARPDNNGIAIHYSYPSIHGSWIVDGKVQEKVTYHTSSAFDRFNENRDGWVKILKDAGLQFDFIAYSDVEKGGLLSKKYRTFILPMSIALSEREAAAIREFVRQGGTVIADALPGIMDEHCTFRKQRLLGDVFGVEWQPSDRDALVEGRGGEQVTLLSAQPFLEADGKRILLRNQFGSGRAYLLNYLLHSYPADKLEGKSGAALLRFKRLLEDAGIIPPVRLASAGGAGVNGCPTYLFNNGSTQLLGLVPDKGRRGAEKIRIITGGGPRHIYDVRQKRYLGFAAEVETDIEPAVPRLFAFVGRPAGRIELTAPARMRRGAEIQIGIHVAGVDDLRSVARVEVRDPRGQTVRYYSGNEDVVDSRAVKRLMTALNDPAGIWQVEVTEVISGKKALAKIRVE
jgi:hypothetical protein